MLRVVSLNTWKGEGRYRDRLRLMAQGLAALKPDLVFLQECLEAEALRLDTVQALAHALGLASIRARGRRKVRRVEGREAPTWSSLALLTNARVVGSHVLALPAHPDDPDRQAQFVDLQWEQADAAFRAVNLHLTHIRAPGGEETRQAQAALAVDEARRDWCGPVIFGGDFNAAPDEAAMRPFLDDPACDPGPNPIADAPGTLQGERPGGVSYDVAVDHVILHSGASAPVWRLARRWNALDAPDPHLGVFPSDHCAVAADVLRV